MFHLFSLPVQITGSRDFYLWFTLALDDSSQWSLWETLDVSLKSLLSCAEQQLFLGNNTDRGPDMAV